MPHHETVLRKFFSVLSISLAVPVPIVQWLQGRIQGGGGGGIPWGCRINVACTQHVETREFKSN